jgi:hypothetical protein
MVQGLMSLENHEERTHHQGPGMKAALVLGRFKVAATEVQDDAVIAPQKEDDDGVEGPGADDLGPDGVGGDVHGGHGVEGRIDLGLGGVTLRDVHGDEDGTSDDGETQEEIAAHVGEAQEDGGIETHAIGQIVFFEAGDGRDPGEDALADGRRGMVLVGELEFRSIYDGMAGSEQGEKEGERGGDGQGGA